MRGGGKSTRGGGFLRTTPLNASELTTQETLAEEGRVVHFAVSKGTLTALWGEGKGAG